MIPKQYCPEKTPENYCPEKIPKKYCQEKLEKERERTSMTFLLYFVWHVPFSIGGAWLGMERLDWQRLRFAGCLHANALPRGSSEWRTDIWPKVVLYAAFAHS